MTPAQRMRRQRMSAFAARQRMAQHSNFANYTDMYHDLTDNDENGGEADTYILPKTRDEWWTRERSYIDYQIKLIEWINELKLRNPQIRMAVKKYHLYKDRPMRIMYNYYLAVKVAFEEAMQRIYDK